jgi:hypothetical protein
MPLPSLHIVAIGSHLRAAQCYKEKQEQFLVRHLLNLTIWPDLSSI